MSIVVTFSSPPRFVATGGLLYSSVGKLQFGTQPVKTGVDATGTATVETRILESDRTNTQIVPISLLHGRLGTRGQLSAYATLGIGLNANNGSKQVEYFLGVSGSIRDVFISVGRHYARQQALANGFAVNDLVPEKFAGLPVVRRSENDWSLVLSYRLPLP
jgi:hypothetical protein